MSSFRNISTIFRGGMRCPRETQELIIGRKKLSDIELDDSVKPTSAHSALTVIVENGKEVKILRDNMPFGRVSQGEFGTYFIGYSRSPRTIEQMLAEHVYRPAARQLRPVARLQPGRHRKSLFRAVRNLSGGCDRRARRRGDRSPCPDPTAQANAARWFARHRLPERTFGMNNLHRELAPISDAAWAQIEEETTRTLKRYLAGRRVVDMPAAGGTGLAAVGTGHLHKVAAPADGIIARLRESKPLVELRVPFELARDAIDDVERGANDSDWQPAKDAAKKIAYRRRRRDLRRLPGCAASAASARERAIPS